MQRPSAGEFAGGTWLLFASEIKALLETAKASKTVFVAGQQLRSMTQYQEAVGKIRDVFDHSDQLNLRDFQMLKLGRHFRIGRRTKVVMGRNEAENELLERAIQPPTIQRCVNLDSTMNTAYVGITSGFLSTTATAQTVAIQNFSLRSE